MGSGKTALPDERGRQRPRLDRDLLHPFEHVREERVDDMRVRKSCPTTSGPRSPRTAIAPRFTPKCAPGSGSVPYSASFVENGKAMDESEYTPNG